MYADANWIMSQDSPIENVLLLGIIIRLGMAMGIHREWPGHPEISEFRAEMRRRIWTAICTMDIAISFQFSLPPIIQAGEYNTALPRNLHDEDISEDMTKLPPARPQTECTKVSYIIIKSRILKTFSNILKANEQYDELPRNEVHRFEDNLNAIRNSMPPQLQMGFAGKVVTQGVKKQRLQLDRLIQLATCMLYRKFLNRAHKDEKVMHFRRSCIEAALSLISYQGEIYTALGATHYHPEGVRRRHVFGLTSHDFYVAGMAVAIDLHHGLIAEPHAPKGSDIKIWGFDRRLEMIAALEESAAFWQIAKSESVEAAKAWGLFSFCANRARRMLSSSERSPASQHSSHASENYNPGLVDQTPSCEAMTNVATPADSAFDWVRLQPIYC